MDQPKPVTAERLIEILQRCPPSAVIRVTGDGTVATVVQSGQCYGCSSVEVHIR